VKRVGLVDLARGKEIKSTLTAITNDASLSQSINYDTHINYYYHYNFNVIFVAQGELQ